MSRQGRSDFVKSVCNGRVPIQLGEIQAVTAATALYKRRSMLELGYPVACEVVRLIESCSLTLSLSLLAVLYSMHTQQLLLSCEGCCQMPRRP